MTDTQTKKFERPQGWKNVVGRKGYFRQSLGFGEIIWAPHLEAWWLATSRSAPKHYSEWWGPWYLRQEKNGRAVVCDWHDRLEKAGWFQLDRSIKGGDEDEEELRIIRKLPRSNAIPPRLLWKLDKRAVLAGKARSGDTLRVGGADLYWRKSNEGGLERFTGIPLDTKATLIAKHAGAHDNLVKNVCFTLDGPSLDTLIAFLIDVRRSVISNEAYQARWELIAARQGDGNDATDDQEPIAETLRNAIEATQVVDGLITRIMDGIRRRPDDLSLYTIIDSILNTGDRIADITVVPDGAQPDMLDVFADPRSVTAGIHPDWVSDHEQAIH